MLSHIHIYLSNMNYTREWKMNSSQGIGVRATEINVHCVK